MNLLSEAKIFTHCPYYRESLYYRGFFVKKIHENFVGTLQTVRNIESSVLERCLH